MSIKQSKTIILEVESGKMESKKISNTGWRN